MRTLDFVETYEKLYMESSDILGVYNKICNNYH